MIGSSHKKPRPRKRPRGFQGHVSEIDLRLLRVFHTVAEQGGFSAAEITLGKSKSSISLDISALETRLGITLCLRGRSGFALTDEGREVLEATHALFLNLEQFRQQVNQASGMLGSGLIARTRRLRRGRLRRRRRSGICHSVLRPVSSP